ncbi:MAG: hypothetical protein ABI574_14860 [Burkholderiales bacterium]
MKVRYLKPAILTATLCCATGLAAAQPASGPATPGIDKRQANQEKRIEQGEASGSLTPREANRLERQQGRVEKVEQTAKADGTVTAKERRTLHRMQDRDSARIARQKHDRQHQ